MCESWTIFVLICVILSGYVWICPDKCESAHIYTPTWNFISQFRKMCFRVCFLCVKIRFNNTSGLRSLHDDSSVSWMHPSAQRACALLYGLNRWIQRAQCHPQSCGQSPAPSLRRLWQTDFALRRNAWGWCSFGSQTEMTVAPATRTGQTAV